MNKKYMRENLPDMYGFLELQNKILEIMIYIDTLCQEYDIEYCLMGGSALGAKRHGGFIPWDDDLDIFMTPDNYEKFRDVFIQRGDKEKYYLQELGLTNGMVTVPKLRMNGTTYIEEIVKDWDMHHGVYVDIFILHSCPNNTMLQLRQCIWAKYIILRGLSNRGYSRRKGIVGIILKLMKILPKKFLVNHALKEVYRFRYEKTDYFCNFLGKAVFKKGIYKREWFENSQYASFETVQLKLPKKLHEFLTERFGDYMKIPSQERIKWEQHAWKWDVDKDFREYVSNIKDFRDEKYLI
jgi:lipopolysaccharide cholinephosphotransferase